MQIFNCICFLFAKCAYLFLSCNFIILLSLSCVYHLSISRKVILISVGPLNYMVGFFRVIITRLRFYLIVFMNHGYPVCHRDIFLKCVTMQLLCNLNDASINRMLQCNLQISRSDIIPVNKCLFSYTFELSNPTNRVGHV